MGNSKIVYYGETLIDLTGDTVEAAKLLKGITAHDKKGEKITGTFEAADPYAIIGVTYPSGSVCTCTNGTLTLTAKDTSGKAIFVIPSAGTWTVTAVSGSQSKSATVEITYEGQIETVVLAFRIALYTDGVENVTWTAKSSTYAKAAKAAAYFRFYTRENFTGDASQVYTPNPIDLTGCSSVSFEGSFVSANTLSLGIYSSNPQGDSMVENAIAKITLNSQDKSDSFIKTLDISSISSSIKSGCYLNIGCYAYYPGGAVTLATVSKVYAE